MCMSNLLNNVNTYESPHSSVSLWRHTKARLGVSRALCSSDIINATYFPVSDIIWTVALSPISY